ncbi:MAG TPA: TlpA disulfide reductase family protein [Gemmataceae bacterium]
MRRISAGALGLALVLAAPAAAQPPAPAAAAPAAKPVREQVDDLARAFKREIADLDKQFTAARTAEDKEKLRDQALNHVAPAYGKKMLALATAHPTDPAAADALAFVCEAPGVSQSALVPEAVKLLLRDHAGSDHLAVVCQVVAQRPDDGERLIRDSREKSTNTVVTVAAGYFLAEALRDRSEPTVEQSREAERLYAEFIAAARTVREIPPDMVKEAEAGLKDLRVFGVGKVAPAAEATDLAGRKVSLADYKGKVVVLDFWFTGCGVCVEMIPHERKLVQRLSGRPFALVSVSADEKPEEVTEFLKDTPMPWQHWHSGPDKGVVAAWNIRVYPTLYVIDAKGVIRGRFLGGGPSAERKLDALVEKLVKEAE